MIREQLRKQHEILGNKIDGVSFEKKITVLYMSMYVYISIDM